MEILSYVNLITSEHAVQPNFVSFASNMFQKIIDCSEIDFAAAFDLDTATGVQLDTIGAVLGRSRTLTYQPSSGSPVLDDTNYRLVLRAKILQNQWDGTVEDALANWTEIFPEALMVIKDNQDMTMSVTVLGIADTFVREMVQNNYVVPKPQSVGTSYSFATSFVFGYGPATSIVAGYGTGEWI